MTREEAKEIIIETRDDFKANPMLEVEDCLYEAIDMAISALSENNVLDKIRAEIEQYIDKEKLSFGGQFDRGLNLAIKIIDKYKTESEE